MTTEDLSDCTVPIWAENSIAIEEPPNHNGYECWRIERNKMVVGWAYDLGAGILWFENIEAEDIKSTLAWNDEAWNVANDPRGR